MLPTFMLRLCFVPNSTFRKKMFFLKYRIDCFLRFNKLVAFVTFAKVKPGDEYDKQYQPKFQLSDVVPFSDQGVFERLRKVLTAAEPGLALAGKYFELLAGIYFISIFLFKYFSSTFFFFF